MLFNVVLIDKPKYNKSTIKHLTFNGVLQGMKYEPYNDTATIIIEKVEEDISWIEQPE